MRKLLLLLMVILGISASAQSYSDSQYAYLELDNAYSQNIVDFKLTYDNYSGNDNCYNNIQIFAQDIDINLYFQIYLNDVKVYDGWAKLSANTSYYLDNAYYDCNSSRKDIRIETQGRL